MESTRPQGEAKEVSLGGRGRGRTDMAKGMRDRVERGRVVYWEQLNKCRHRSPTLHSAPKSSIKSIFVTNAWEISQL